MDKKVVLVEGGQACLASGMPVLLIECSPTLYTYKA